MRAMENNKNNPFIEIVDHKVTELPDPKKDKDQDQDKDHDKNTTKLQDEPQDMESEGNPEVQSDIKTEIKSEAKQEKHHKHAGHGRDQKEPEEKKPGVLSEIIEWIKILVFAAVAAFLLNNFIIANSTVPTGSMENTIMAGSRVFGSRLKYTFGDVARDDVAIFIYGYTCRNCGAEYRETDAGVCPNCGQADSKNRVIYYVKRVIGMPGDHIEIKKTGEVDASEISKLPVKSSTGKVPVGTLYVNGEAKEEVYLPEPMICDGNQFPEVDVTVPEGCYYMLGDNRNNSMDARYWGSNNFVKRDRMIAKVYVKYWPLSEMGMVH